MRESVNNAGAGAGRGVAVYEKPIGPGWVYPCTVEDIRECIRRMPACDLNGLAAVVLTPVTRKDHSANARYFCGEHPVIEVYAFSESLTYKLPCHTKRSSIDAGLAMELEYGMTVRRVGARWFCDWTPQRLRRFVLQHVFLHEVGHHVFHSSRQREGLAYKPGRTSEVYAESYAFRHRSLFEDILD